MNKNQVVLKIILPVIGLAVIGLAIGILRQNLPRNQSSEPTNQQIPDNKYQVKAVRPIDQTDHLWGPADAPVQLILYDDFECPYCFDFYQTVKEIKEEFGDQVVVAFRHYPLSIHPNALIAAEAAECAAEQDKFWPMYDQLFADNLAKRMNREQFKKDATNLDLDQVKFNQCLEREKYKDKVMAQMLAGKGFGVTGTPTIFVNAEIYPGAYPFLDFTAPDGRAEEGMKSIIERQLKK